MKNKLIVMLVLLTFLASCAGTSKVQTTPRAAVDLGLPSGTLWANCNVGASNPWDFGEHFAWGETTPNATYTWATYKYSHENTNKLTKYSNKFSGFEGYTDSFKKFEDSDDAATANWGSEWSTPNSEQWAELQKECTWTWKTVKNVNGYEVKGKNGKTIFLPAAGRMEKDAKLVGGGERGFYMDGEVVGMPFNKTIYLKSSGFSFESNDKCMGLSVRPVQTKK